MTRIASSSCGIAALLAMALGAAPALAQRQPAPGAAPATIDLRVGAGTYEAKGQGLCKSAQGSIHGVAATQYNVQHREGDRSLAVTLWQPKDGAADMLQLQVSRASGRVEVDTVKGGNKQSTKGSSRSAFRKSGAGGVLEIDAVAATGEKVTGRIECGRFATIRAEGG